MSVQTAPAEVPSLGGILDEIEDAIALGAGEQVLNALLAAWRQRRLPILTKAIEELSHRFEAVLPWLPLKSERANYERFLDRVAGRRSVDVPNILADLPRATVIRAKDHLERLAVMDTDPRIARALVDHVSTQRFNLYNKVWTGVFREIRRHGDVETRQSLTQILATLPKIPPAELGGTIGLPKHGFRDRIETAIAHLPESLPVDSADENRLQAILLALGNLTLNVEPNAKSAPSHGTAHPNTSSDEGSLWAQVIAQLDDDAPRLVLADLWTERGDPRGEFVALQIRIARAPSPMVKDLKREKQMLKAHLTELLGPIEPVIDRKTCRFSRGFLEHAAVKFKTASQRKELLGHQAFSTLRSLESRDFAVIRHPTMTHIESLSGLSWKNFYELANGSPMTSIRELQLDIIAADPSGADIAQLSGLPNLEKLTIGAVNPTLRGEPPWEWPLLQGFARHLGTVELHVEAVLYYARLQRILDSLDRAPSIRQITFALKIEWDRSATLQVQIARTPVQTVSKLAYQVTLASETPWPAELFFQLFVRRDAQIRLVRPGKREILDATLTHLAKLPWVSVEVMS